MENEEKSEVSYKKKKLEVPVSEDNSELWLVSYADLMTLVACFFILMVAFANFEPVAFANKAKEIARHFNPDNVEAKTTDLEELGQGLAVNNEIKQNTKITVHDDHLLINFNGSALFDSGRSELRPEILPVLDAMIDLIKTRDQNFRILVEGHTDGTRLPASSPFKGNWALSGARAASVIERFELFGFIPTNMVSIGLADTQPLAPEHDDAGNAIPENMQLNRRVVIKVLRPKNPEKNFKLGLGVYFQEKEPVRAQPVPQDIPEQTKN